MSNERETQRKVNMPIEIVGIITAAGDRVVSYFPDELKGQYGSLDAFNIRQNEAHGYPHAIGSWSLLVKGQNGKQLRLLDIEQYAPGTKIGSNNDCLFEISGTAKNLFIQWAKKYEQFGDPPVHATAFPVIMNALLVNKRYTKTFIHGEGKCSDDDVFEIRYESSVGSMLQNSYRIVFFPDVFMDEGVTEDGMWQTDVSKLPDYEREVYALVDSEADWEEPEVVLLKLVQNSEGSNPAVSWHLVSYDKNEQEELLQQRYSVIAWRYRQTTIAKA